MFICNHCPFVKAIVDKLVIDANTLQKAGIGVVAINANDAANYPEDSYDHMISFAKTHKFSFPYLHDATQSIAKKRRKALRLYDSLSERMRISMVGDIFS